MKNQLNYTEFIGTLRQKLYQILPEDMGMEVHQVLKNNSIQLDSLVLYSGDCSVSPNFYMQDYFGRYQNGAKLPKLAEEIYQKWLRIAQTSQKLIPELSFHDCKERIVYRLINTQKNKQLLEESPHIPFLDLSIIFYYLVGKQYEGIQSIRISNQLMKLWQLDTKTLMELASDNTPRLFPVKFYALKDLLYESLLSFAGYEEEESIEKETEEFFEPYVLTNEKGINGAAAWIYPGELEHISGMCQKDLYILPSSIHELLIVPGDQMMPEQDMLELVRQVNKDCVSEENFLSDSIYFYDRNKKAMKVISA